MIDDATRIRIERDIAVLHPFTMIAARHGVSYVDVALIHHRIGPNRPLQWPEAISPDLWNEAAAALAAEPDDD